MLETLGLTWHDLQTLAVCMLWPSKSDRASFTAVLNVKTQAAARKIAEKLPQKSDLRVELRGERTAVLEMGPEIDEPATEGAPELPAVGHARFALGSRVVARVLAQSGMAKPMFDAATVSLDASQRSFDLRLRLIDPANAPQIERAAEAITKQLSRAADGRREAPLKEASARYANGELLIQGLIAEAGLELLTKAQALDRQKVEADTASRPRLRPSVVR
jgi:hypothetical protein